MKGVEHRDGVLELVVDGVLVAVERVQGRDADSFAEGLVAGLEPLGIGRTRASGNQVEQPRLGLALRVASQLDHPGQLLWPPPAVLDQLGGDVVPVGSARGRGDDTAVVPFPRTARRTRRATLTAPGSPREVVAQLVVAEGVHGVGIR